MLRFFSNARRKEIALVLVLKLLALTLIWICFFSKPITPKLNRERLEVHWLA